MYACTHACVYVCMCVCMWVCICVCICVCLRVCVHVVYVCVFLLFCMYTQVCAHHRVKRARKHASREHARMRQESTHTCVKRACTHASAAAAETRAVSGMSLATLRHAVCQHCERECECGWDFFCHIPPRHVTPCTPARPRNHPRRGRDQGPWRSCDISGRARPPVHEPLCIMYVCMHVCMHVCT